MAVSSFKYCSHRDVKDVYPNINQTDSKTPLRGTWVEVDSTQSQAVNTWICKNTGLVSDLFKNGAQLKQYATTTTPAIRESINPAENNIDVDNVAFWTDESYIKLGSEILYVNALTDTTQDYITAVRGRLDTTASTHSTGLTGTKIMVPDAEGLWYYDSELDLLLITSATDPNEDLYEAGEDWATLIDRMITNCSMELSAELDARFPRPIPKAFQYAEATDGSDTPEYDYILKRATALLVAHHLLVSKDPLSEEAIGLKEEVDSIVGRLNAI